MLRSLALLTLIALAEAAIDATPAPPQCPRNMEFREIADLCEPTCAAPEPTCQIQEIVLWPFELSRCQCKKGFYRQFLTGPCVPRHLCSTNASKAAAPKRVIRAALPYQLDRKLRNEQSLKSVAPKRSGKKQLSRKMKRKQARMSSDEAKSLILEKTLLKPFASLVYGPIVMLGR